MTTDRLFEAKKNPGRESPDPSDPKHRPESPDREKPHREGPKRAPNTLPGDDPTPDWDPPVKRRGGKDAAERW